MVERLTPVRCGWCSKPVSLLNQQQRGEGGGMCKRCNKDDAGRSMKVYTFIKVIEVTAQ